MPSGRKERDVRGAAVFDYGLHLLLGVLIALFTLISHSFLSRSN